MLTWNTPTFLNHIIFSRAYVGLPPVPLAEGVCIPAPEGWLRVSSERGGRWTVLDMPTRLFGHKCARKALLMKDGVGDGKRRMVGQGLGASICILTWPANIRAGLLWTPAAGVAGEKCGWRPHIFDTSVLIPQDLFANIEASQVSSFSHKSCFQQRNVHYICFLSDGHFAQRSSYHFSSGNAKRSQTNKGASRAQPFSSAEGSLPAVASQWGVCSSAEEQMKLYPPSAPHTHTKRCNYLYYLYIEMTWSQVTQMWKSFNLFGIT